MIGRATDLHVLQCGTCGVWHAIPKIMHDACVEEGGFWHCPNGHARGYQEGRKEREAIRRERDRLKQENARLRDMSTHHERSAAAYKGQATRLRNRAKAGVCPCCNRSFENLRRHMKTKHPDFADDLKESVAEKGETP